MKKSIYSSKSSVCYLLGLIYYTGISEKAVFCLKNEYLGSSLLMPGIKLLQRYHVIYFLKICGTFFGGGKRGRKILCSPVKVRVAEMLVDRGCA